MYRINKSVERILKIKEKYDLYNETDRGELDIGEINSRIQRIRDEVL